MPPMPVEEAHERALDEATKVKLGACFRINLATNFSRGFPPPPWTQALKRMRDRRIKANERARAAREHALAKKEREAVEAELAKEREGAADTEESGSRVGGGGGTGKRAKKAEPVGADAVGFDASKEDYTEAELTAMAVELYKKNAELGLDEEGKPLPALLR